MSNLPIELVNKIIMMTAKDIEYDYLQHLKFSFKCVDDDFNHNVNYDTKWINRIIECKGEYNVYLKDKEKWQTNFNNYLDYKYGAWARNPVYPNTLDDTLLSDISDDESDNE